MTAATSDPLHIDGLSLAVAGRELLRDVTFHVRAGNSVAIMGASGTGKSSLVRCIVGGSRPAAGRVKVDGRDVHRLRSRDLRRLRAASIGVLFQHGELLGELSAVENVAVPLLLAGSQPSNALAAAAAELAALGLSDVAETKADDLSGGERQRTALARALVGRPRVVIADEPTGALDAAARDSVCAHLFARTRQTRAALLVVTHDPAVAARADRVLRVAGGRLHSAAPDRVVR